MENGQSRDTCIIGNKTQNEHGHKNNTETKR